MQLSKMKAEHATLATKHRLTVAALQRKLKSARAALRELHSKPTVPSATAFLPMPPATMPELTAKLSPTVTIIDAEATTMESVPVLDVEVASSSSAETSEDAQIPSDGQDSVQLESRAATLETELTDAEENLKECIQELDEAGTLASMQGVLYVTVHTARMLFTECEVPPDTLFLYGLNRHLTVAVVLALNSDDDCWCRCTADSFGRAEASQVAR